MTSTRLPRGVEIRTSAVKTAITNPIAKEITAIGMVYLIPAHKISGVELVMISHINYSSVKSVPKYFSESFFSVPSWRSSFNALLTFFCSPLLFLLIIAAIF